MHPILQQLLCLCLVIATGRSAPDDHYTTDGFISDRPLSDYITQFEPLYYDRQLLQSDHHRVKRSADRQLTLQIHAYGRTWKIRLTRDTGIYSPDLVVENGTNTVQYDASRAYVGYVEGEDSSVYGMVTSDGLFEGQIHKVDEQYIVERASRYFKDTTTVSGSSFVQPSFHSVIYKHSAVDTGNINSSLCLSDLLHRKLMDEQRQMGSAWYRQRSREGDRYADTVLNRFDTDPFRDRASIYHQYNRDVDPQKTTCTMYIQADHLFYEKFDRNEDTVIEQLTQHVQGVNEIYRKIDFDGDGYPDNINFIIKRIKIWTSAKAPGYKFAGNYGVETFLELLSEDNFDAFCLAYMFTYRDFDGGTLGLAWTGDIQNAGGVCEKYGQHRGSLRNLNSGLVTILNYGKDVPPSVSHVTMAHEVGHNLGSQHDPETLECSPGGSIGNYIMYARATSGDRPNNNKFSTCSTQSMAQVMSVKARGHDGCFIPATSAICGNAVVEGDEECDCGWEDECQEQCCHPQVSSGGSGIPCTRKRGAECSPSEGPCCSSNCKLIGGSHSDRRYPCREPKSFCPGSANRLEHIYYTYAYGDPRLRYDRYKDMFGNCTVVEKSVEIVYLDGPGDYDMSFLSSIREIKGSLLIYGNTFTSLPLTKLRLVQGLSLYAGSSVYVSNNPGLKEVQMPSIRDILEGNVHFESNENLCYINTIEWRDILSTTAGTVSVEPSPLCNECNSTCEFNGTKRCWGAGPDMCQRINRLTCSDSCESGCFGPGVAQCCDSLCAGGCMTSRKNCRACRHFNDSGACVDRCPPEKIYNRKSMKLEANPDAKYAYGTDCVKNCPNDMLVEDGYCVTTCQAGRLPNEDNHCVPCDNGICPRICNGTDGGLHAGQLDNFNGCTIIEGSLQIITTSFLGDPFQNRSGIQIEELAVLKTVQEITEFLYVDAISPNLTSLSFLKNLKVIHGRRLYRDETNSLMIHGTKVEDLGLISLREVKNGIIYISNNQNLTRLGLVSLETVRGVGSKKTAIYIANNPRLCYVHNFNFTGLFDPSKKVVIATNAPKQECESWNATCSSKCTSDGCWGPGDDECRFCKDYRFGRRCIESCNATPGLYEVGKECRKCHDECHDSCRGEGSDNCTACRHVKDGPYCVATCPDIKYPDENGVCRECDANCRNGCTGPSGFLGDGGCNDCDIFIEETMECKPENHDCGYGYYRAYQLGNVWTKNGTSLKKELAVCRRCDDQCKTCVGFGSHENVCECLKYRHANHCVESCPDGNFGDEYKNCQRCHAECETCQGFGLHETECECLNYKHANYCVGTCPGGYYGGINKVCYKCHAVCNTCVEFGSHETVCECLKYKHANHCVGSCPDGFYHDGNKVCQKCHKECKQCIGPSRYNCTMCENYRVYLGREELDSRSSHIEHTDEEINEFINYSDEALSGTAAKVTGNFICNNSCPDWAPKHSIRVFENQQQLVCFNSARRSSYCDDYHRRDNVIFGAVALVTIFYISQI